MREIAKRALKWPKHFLNTAAFGTLDLAATSKKANLNFVIYLVFIILIPSLNFCLHM